MIQDEDAINSLIPNTEWHYRAGVLTIFTEGVSAPTPAEIAAEKIRLTELLAEQEAAKAAKKLAAEAKLAALGLDADDLRALGLA